MHGRLAQVIDRLRTGFWFLPSVMILLATALALTLLWADEKIDPGITSKLPWAYSGGPEGARSLLSTIAGSMITAASVTFSLASVALSISSQQYGSRVLRNFMRDRTTQVLLGTFTSTFVYSVLVVRSIRGTDVSGGFVPAVSVTGSIVLTMASLILLVYFIHHVSTSIQAAHIVSVITHDLDQSIPALYPPLKDHSPGASGIPSDARKPPRHAFSRDKSGYVQSVDLEVLLKYANSSDVMLELPLKPGDYYIAGTELAILWGSTAVDEKAGDVVHSAIILGGERTPLQDVRYEFQQLTDVIIRSLSPGINDPFTAIDGIDALANALRRLAERPRASEMRTDSEGRLRLLVATPRLEDVLHDTLGHIALYASKEPFVLNSLLRAARAVEPLLVSEAEHDMLSALTEDMEKHLRQTAARGTP